MLKKKHSFHSPLKGPKIKSTISPKFLQPNNLLKYLNTPGFLGDSSVDFLLSYLCVIFTCIVIVTAFLSEMLTH